MGEHDRYHELLIDGLPSKFTPRLVVILAVDVHVRALATRHADSPGVTLVYTSLPDHALEQLEAAFGS